MKRFVFAVLLLLSLGPMFTSCSSSPEALAKEDAKAMNRAVDKNDAKAMEKAERASKSTSTSTLTIETSIIDTLTHIKTT